jgi:hypothetical protein
LASNVPTASSFAPERSWFGSGERNFGSVRTSASVKIDGVVRFEPVSRAKRRISVYPPDVYPLGGGKGLIKPAHESVAYAESGAAD